MRLFMMLAVMMVSFGGQAEAQTRAGSTPINTGSSQVVDNACRERVNDLRTFIGSLRDDINKIRECSENGQLAVRDAGSVVCRDVTQGHHVWDAATTNIRFATDPDTFGDNKSLLGLKGNPGRDVRCEPCAETWEPPICVDGWTAQYCSTGNNADCIACWGESTHIPEVCGSFGETCALPATADTGNWSSCDANCETTCSSQECRRLVNGQPTGDVVACGYCGLSPSTATTCDVPAAQSCSGGSCSACDEWTAVNSWCAPLNRNVVSSHTCPSGNCCDPEPATETCPDACSPGFYTYDYTNWTICEAGQQTRECERCDGQSADCGECGGECSRTCTPTCTTYSWIPSSGWGACSGGGSAQNCGTGTQTRPGSCRCDQSGETVSDSLCALADRQRNCSGWTYGYTDWGSCSGASKSRECERCDGTTVACSNCGGQCSSNEGCGPILGMSCVCASPNTPPSHLRFRCATPADFAPNGSMNCLYNHYATPAPLACGNEDCEYGCWDFRSMMPMDHCPYPVLQ